MSGLRKFTLSRAQSGAEMGANARIAKGEHLIRYGDTIEVVEVKQVDLIRHERNELMKAIREHRDQWEGDQVTDAADAKLYDALVWCDTYMDHSDDEGPTL